MRNIFRFLAVVLVLASLVSIVGCSSGSQEVASNNSVAVQMLKILPSNFDGFIYMNISELRTDEHLSGWLEYFKEVGNMDFPEQANGFGTGTLVSDDIFMLEGIVSIDQIYGNDSIESYNYGGFSVWTKYYSSVLIDGIYVEGRDETLRACIDVVNGKADSMYDAVKDVVGRLPVSFMLNIQVSPPLHGTSGAIQGDKLISTEIYELNSPAAALYYAEFLYNESVTHDVVTRDITTDSIFVTVVTTMLITPTPTE